MGLVLLDCSMKKMRVGMVTVTSLTELAFIPIFIPKWIKNIFFKMSCMAFQLESHIISYLFTNSFTNLFLKEDNSFIFVRIFLVTLQLCLDAVTSASFDKSQVHTCCKKSDSSRTLPCLYLYIPIFI